MKNRRPDIRPADGFASRQSAAAAHLPIRLVAFLSLMDRVGTVTFVGADAAQSSRTDVGFPTV